LALECDAGYRSSNATAPRCYPFWICTICRWFVIVGSTCSGRLSHGLLLPDITANQVFDCSDRRIPVVVASNNSPLSTADANKLLANPVAMISEIKHIEASVLLGVTNHEANHVEGSRIDHLTRKGIRKIGGTARLGK